MLILKDGSPGSKSGSSTPATATLRKKTQGPSSRPMLRMGGNRDDGLPLVISEVAAVSAVTCHLSPVTSVTAVACGLWPVACHSTSSFRFS